MVLNGDTSAMRSHDVADHCTAQGCLDFLRPSGVLRPAGLGGNGGRHLVEVMEKIVEVGVHAPIHFDSGACN